MTVTEKPDVPDTEVPDAADAADPPETTDAPDAQDPPEIRVEIRVSDDRLRVFLNAADPLAAPDRVVEAAIEAWRSQDLPDPPAPDTLAALLQEHAVQGRDLDGLVLREGTPPVRPRDGRLEWTKDYFTEGWAIDEETGRIDFWEKLDNRNVTNGQLLVTVFDPTDGVPGTDVFGNPINVDKPKAVKIRCGKGVHEQAVDGGTGVYASRNGKVRFNDNTVAVDDVLVIKGDVSLETGNIHHNGTVTIEGDVREGATIETLGDVEVRGMLEPCHIRAGGGLAVGGGIVSEEGYRITVGGDVQARYIHQADMDVEGDVMVIREIAHSRIRSRGKVDISQGRIAGGQTVARKGVFVAEAGAGGSGTTELVAGVDPALPARLKAVYDRRARMEQARDTILATIRGHLEKGVQLTPDQQELVAGLRKRAETIGKAMAAVEGELQALRDEAQDGARLEVVMYKEVRSGTVIRLGDYQMRVRNSILKPRIAQLRRKKVRVLPLGEGNMPEE